MKIAVTGKGGVGKTTIAATLARLYADEGKTVYAADADPDADYSANEDEEEDYVKKLQSDGETDDGGQDKTDDAGSENEDNGADPDEPEE